MTAAELQRFLAFLLAFAALVVWRFTYHTSCAALIVVLIVATVIGAFTLQLTIMQRRCFANCFFRGGTLAYRFAGAHVVSCVLAVISALLGTTFLLFNFLVWTTTEMAILFSAWSAPIECSTLNVS